jgi:hypothetical protein
MTRNQIAGSQIIAQKRETGIERSDCQQDEESCHPQPTEAQYSDAVDQSDGNVASINRFTDKLAKAE